MYITRRHAGRSTFFYEESIFETFEDAKKYVDHITDEEDETFVTEIVSYVVGSYESWEDKQVWFYNNKGELITTAEERASFSSSRTIHSPTFKVGDLVVVPAFCKNKYGLDEDIVGVVGESTPEQIASGEKDISDVPDYDYTVYYITETGQIDHVHPDGRGVLEFEGDLPRELEFLSILRDHIIGKKRIANDIYKRIWSRDVNLRNIVWVDWGQDKDIVRILSE